MNPPNINQNGETAMKGKWTVGCVIEAGSHVMVIEQPELTGIVARTVGDRALVDWDHAALDSLTTEMWNHGAQEWYDRGELARIP